MASSKLSNKKALVLDSTAFYSGVPFAGQIVFYTTPSVLEEIARNRELDIGIKGVTESERMIIIEPRSQWIDEVVKRSIETSDISALSDVDISVIALALQLRHDGYDVSVVTDDYSIQNLIIVSGLKYFRTNTIGISRIVEWMVYCIGCGKTFKNRKLDFCDVCGSKLKRRAKQVRNIS